MKAETRTVHGSRAAERLRKDGKVPGIIYGHGETPLPVAVSQHDLELILHQGAHLLEVELAGAGHHVLIKDVQYDYLGSTPIHVDLARVNLDERVRVTVPIELRGPAKGVKEGGTVDQTIADLEVECLVTQIPESIRVNITELGIDDSLHVGDIVLPEGVRAIPAADLVVCSIRAPIAEAAAPAGEEEGATAEPELIGRKEKAAEEEGEEEEKKKK